jgi:pyruvate dehydrogenase E2 component (dihydrolipoamide acetyltransferase)
MQTVKLPELGEGVTEGELVKWLVKPGDLISPDQPIAEVMTDKATVEVPSPFAGKVLTLKYQVGDTVKVETALIEIETSAGSTTYQTASATSIPPTALAKPAASAVSTMPAVMLANSVPQASSNIVPPPADLRVLATPSTRRLARELNVDINSISGSGLAGRVTREDVLRWHSDAQSGSSEVSSVTISSVLASQGEERVPLRGIRKKIAENMQMAKRVIPHFTLMEEAIVTELVKVRDQVKSFAEEQNVKITYLPFVMKALIATVREFPVFNASIDDEKQEIVYKKYFNIGFAADTPNGLVVPVIKGVDAKNIIELSNEISDLSKRARDGKLKPEEMKGATITITNIGSIGGTYATPIINHPEVAILGMYKIVDKVVAKGDGQFGVEKAMNFTITADHRLIDGAVAARFLKAFTDRISQPNRMLIELK